MKTYKGLVLFFTLLLAFSGAFGSSGSFSGHVSYTLKKVANPTADESDAYAKIIVAMDSAMWFYNTYTTITKKITVNYDVSVGTADANSKGNMRFGKDRAFMKGRTALHETSHTVGVGTTDQWNKLMKNGIYTGVNGTDKLRKITSDPKAVINGDSKAPFQHFWPYGLNYDSEAKSKDDFINHCLIVNAMQKDMFPTAASADVPATAPVCFTIALNPANTFTFSLPLKSSVVFGIFTLSGKKVYSIRQETMAAGSHAISINSQYLPHGLYVYRFQAGQHQESNTFPLKY
jgi:hypothetical protein